MTHECHTKMSLKQKSIHPVQHPREQGLKLWQVDSDHKPEVTKPKHIHENKDWNKQRSEYTLS